MRGAMLVAVQVAALAVLAIAGPILSPDAWAVPQLAGLALGAWGVLAQRIGNFNVRPAVRERARLVTRGPYRTIRHPMYAGLLLWGAATTCAHPTPWTAAASAVLAIDLVLKLRLEERLLGERFPAYAAYARTTWRLIPFVW